MLSNDARAASSLSPVIYVLPLTTVSFCPKVQPAKTCEEETPAEPFQLLNCVPSEFFNLSGDTTVIICPGMFVFGEPSESSYPTIYSKEPRGFVPL